MTFISTNPFRVEKERMTGDPNICETVRDAVQNVKDNISDGLHTCDEVKNHSQEPITVCIQDKEKSQQSGGTWRGRTSKVQPGQILKVDRNKEDIEGIIHRDKSVTKFKGFFCDGWTEEHDKKWLEDNWSDCTSATGASVSPRNFFNGLIDSSIYTFARVDSSTDKWQDFHQLAPNRSYRVIPRSSDRWTYDRGSTFVDFHGSNSKMNGWEINIPKNNLPIGGLIVLVWHGLPDGTAKSQIIDFPGGSDSAEFSIGAHGGSIYFIIADKKGTYGDNFGDCIVALTAI